MKEPRWRGGRGEDPMSETEYLINEGQMLLLAMKAETEPAKAARAEMIEIVKAWRRGRLLPGTEAPTLQKLYGTLSSMTL
jgi:hypothetical protein